MPYVLAFALAMIFCALTLPRTSGMLASNFQYAMPELMSRIINNIIHFPLGRLSSILRNIYLG